MSDTLFGPWWVYILRCSDDTLYTGVCTDLERRLKEHNESPLGARYTRSRRPVELLFSEPAANRSAACIREHAIKKKSRKSKWHLIASSIRDA